MHALRQLRRVIVTRSRTVAAAPERSWRVLADPRPLPRWWPRTERVKGVTDDGWTTVLRSDRGRAVRADWRLEAQERAELARAGRSELDGTPFAKVLRERRVEARLEPAEATARA